MKTNIQKIPGKNRQFKQKLNAGFILGMALIILSVLLTISISMTTILIRELKLSSATSASHTAYYLADSAMSCITALNRNAFDIYGNPTSTYPSSDNYSGGTWTNPTTWTKPSITCFERPLFTNIRSTMPTDQPTLNTATVIQTIPHDTSSPGTPAPALYADGIKTSIQIQPTEFITYFEKACVTIEIYTTSTAPNLIVTRGSVPCTGEKRVERVLVRKSN